MINYFTLSKSQAKFLQKEKRKDPITGDKFVPGDEVVFCAGCRSAFHAGSWNYLGNSHCGQEETLTEFPDNKVSVKIKRDPTIFEGEKAHTLVEPNPIPLLFILAAIKVSIFLGILSVVSSPVNIFIGGGIGAGVMLSTYLARHKFKRTFLFFEDKMIIRKGLLKQNKTRKQQVFYYNEISNLLMEHSDMNDKHNRLKIFFKDSNVVTIRLNYTEVDELKNALLKTNLNVRFAHKEGFENRISYFTRIK